MITQPLPSWHYKKKLNGLRPRSEAVLSIRKKRNRLNFEHDYLREVVLTRGMFSVPV